MLGLDVVSSGFGRAHLGLTIGFLVLWLYVLLNSLSLFYVLYGFACQWIGNADMHVYTKCDKNIPCGSRVMNIFNYW